MHIYFAGPTTTKQKEEEEEEKKKYFFAELNPIVKPEETTYQHDRARGAEHREYEKEDDGRGW